MVSTMSVVFCIFAAFLAFAVPFASSSKDGECVPEYVVYVKSEDGATQERFVAFKAGEVKNTVAAVRELAKRTQMSASTHVSMLELLVEQLIEHACIGRDTPVNLRFDSREDALGVLDRYKTHLEHSADSLYPMQIMGGRPHSFNSDQSAGASVKSTMFTQVLYNDSEFMSKSIRFSGPAVAPGFTYIFEEFGNRVSAHPRESKIFDPSRKFMIDVGANLGSYSLPAVGTGVDVVAIEPYPPNADRLELSFRLSGARDGLATSQDNDDGASPSYYLFRNAVSDVSGQRVGLLSNFLRTESVINAGAQTILPLNESHEEGGFDVNHHVIDVTTVTLDEVAERAGLFTRDPVTGLLPLLAMLKMDCEGCEPLALRGARRLFAENPPRIFFTEVHAARLAVSGVKYREYLHGIEQMGYMLQSLESEIISPALTSEHAVFQELEEGNIRDVVFVRIDTV